jgi:hypothetical protein
MRKIKAALFWMFILIIVAGFISNGPDPFVNLALADSSLTSVQASGGLPAFPGAEGWGATALAGCRNLPLVVHQVTNTNDSGPGSFRDAIQQVRGSNFDIIIFRTGGLVQLQSELRADNRDCLYIAGQTAPGGGISFVGAVVGFFDSDDFVIRYIRHRGQSATNFRSNGGIGVIYDHITASWAGASNGGGSFLVHLRGDIAGSGLIHSLDGATIQNSLLYEPDAQHNIVLGLAAGPNHDPQAKRISAHRNVLIGPAHRMPMCSAVEVSFTNNVVYNWGNRASEANNAATCDYIANYHKPGPATSPSNYMPFIFGDGCSGSATGDCFYSFYVSDNRNPRNNYGQITGSAWEGPNQQAECKNNISDTSLKGGWCTISGNPIPQQYRRSTSFSPAPIPVNVQSISDAYVYQILADAGHVRGLACDGSWISVRDAADAQRIAGFYAGTGLTNTKLDVSTISVPVPASGTPCTDSDGDGMPDAWESRYFGSSTAADIAADTDGDGYTNIEEYLNGSDPKAATTPVDDPIAIGSLMNQVVLLLQTLRVAITAPLLIWIQPLTGSPAE